MVKRLTFLLALCAASTVFAVTIPDKIECPIDKEPMPQVSATCYDTFCGVHFAHTNKAGSFHTEYREYKK